MCKFLNILSSMLAPRRASWDFSDADGRDYAGGQPSGLCDVYHRAPTGEGRG